jgi:hypothetical protein
MTTIEQARPRRRIRIDAPREVRCPDCGTIRDVSARHARRIDRGEHDPRCEECRNPREINYTDDDIRWWLERFGRSLPIGADVHAYIRVFGLPEECVVISIGLQHFNVRHLT